MADGERMGGGSGEGCHAVGERMGEGSGLARRWWKAGTSPESAGTRYAGCTVNRSLKPVHMNLNDFKQFSN
jgi:hypothetical protein